MIIRLMASLILLTVVLTASPSASAGETGNAQAADNHIFAAANAEANAPDVAPALSELAVPAADEAGAPSGSWTLEPVCEAVTGGGCVTQRTCEDGSLANTWYFTYDDGTPGGAYTQCPSDPPPSAETSAKPLRVTPAQVLTAFRRILLPKSVVMIPPHGETLVGFPTNVYTEARAFTEQVEFFGGRVMIELDIRPSSFLWHRGDGTSQTTDWPGRAWQPSDGEAQVGLITHAYDAKATDAPVSVDTTWSATWTLNGKDMGEVPGTVTIEGEVKPLDVLEARPVLVG